MSNIIEFSDDIASGDRIYKVHLDQRSLATVKLDKFDRALLDDIENGEKSGTPIADKLLGLETLVRRIEEQSEGEKK